VRSTGCEMLLEGANIKLESRVSDVVGASARAMLEALIAGTTDGAVLADLALGRMLKQAA
jgi:transposase